MTNAPLRTAITAPEGPQQPVTPPARRRKWPWLAGGLVAVAALGSAAYAVTRGDDPPAATTAPARIGAEGPFTVAVTDTACGVRTVGPDDLPQRAKGEFCLVTVAVTNGGKEAELLDGGAQRAVDTRGQAYPVSQGAAVFLNTENPSLLEEIAPGATVRGALPFDVPAGTSLAALVIHESVTSRGVRVPLS